MPNNTTQPIITVPKRCAIYTRKSTEEGLDKEFNTLDAQREACESYIASQKNEGWLLLPQHYNDGGFTGANINRPALTQLLEDIQKSKIDIIVVYKVDRLSRSLTDFAKLIELFNQYNISFVSVTQHFNTTNSMGRLTLNILLSFAQFEREVITERIRDKVAASKSKGIWMGGFTPLGYTAKDRALHIVESEAQSVRTLFELFIKTQSPTQMVKQLPMLGIFSKKRITPKGKSTGGTPLDTSGLYKILNNPIYIGKIKHKHKLYDGRHEPIISQDTWNTVHDILHKHVRKKSLDVKRSERAVLTNLIKCGGCLYTMTPGYTVKKRSKKLYRYYAATSHKKARFSDCSVKQINANKIEPQIWQTVEMILLSIHEITLDTWEATHLLNYSLPETQVRETLSDISLIQQELFPSEQKRLLSLLINQVVVHPEHIDVQFYINGLADLAFRLNLNKASTAVVCDKIENIDNHIVSIKLPNTIKCNKPLKKLILSPHTSVPAQTPTLNKRLIDALIKAHKWQKELDTKQFPSVKALAKHYGIDQSHVYRFLRLNLLSPQIKDAILDGRQPSTMTLEALQHPFPLMWEDQKAHFQFDK